MRKLALWSIKFYRRFLWPLFPSQCRYTPTCSEYTYQAVKKYGTIRGLYLGLKRILKCQSWSN
ncbi:MAG: membrane protein insertion efficiency factor YidD [Patescibacteria group bacterium]|nr:membrane protein insertion efficiency factor YidD [Patescibacteria group bacterium]MCL5431657.1 membrane protein insertion efficiency factor YidD [Patescibacteria group bacterium]